MASDSDMMTDEGDRLTTNDILKGLLNIRRRRILFHLRQNGSATVDELVDLLETDLVDEENSGDQESFRTILYHMDLPKLEELDLVKFDQEADIVRLTVEPTKLGEWLDLAVQRDLRIEMAEAESDRPDTKQVEILIVDDNPNLTDAVEKYFEANIDDISVTTATRVEDAVETFRDQSFDCIVSDLRMPALSGLDFLKVVREEDPEIPFLLFTARGSEEVAREAIESDVTGYVIKSGDPEQFDILAEQIRTAGGQA